MSIWFEVLVLSLIAYTVGLGLGWALWGRDGNGGHDHG